jgi:hypothetical protein
MTAGLDIEASASLGIQLGRIANSLERSLADQQRAQRSVMYIPIKPHSNTVTAGAVTILSHESDLGPRTGYAWAVQRLTVGGLSSGDSVSVYKGPPVSVTADPTMLVQLLTNTTPTWVPGRTGLVLFPGDTIVVTGTGLQATTVTLQGDVIQLEQWIVPEFML